MGIIEILLTLLVFALVVYLAVWIVDIIGLPNPMNKIAKAIIGIIALLVLLQKLGLVSGHMI